MVEKHTPNELRYIHQTMLDLYGGLAGEINPGMIEYVCEKLFFVTYGEEQYTSLFQKASVLMYAIARGHYFSDGNKRTAAMDTYTFLIKNGYELIVSNDNLYNTSIKVAAGELSERKLAKWLKNNAFLIEE